MARSDVEHFGLLNRWPVIMEQSPWHFNQLNGVNAPLTEPCDEVHIQEERDALADSLNLSVELLAENMGFYPRPVWLEARLDLGHGYPMEWQSLKTPFGYLEEFSIRTQTLIAAGVTVTYTDDDGDGVFETATIAQATTVSADELRVYYQTADGASAAGDDDWEIEPLTVSSDGATATITGPAYLFTHPEVVWDNPKEEPNYNTKRPFDSADNANYVTEVDVYRVYGNTTGAVKFLTDPILDSSVSNSGDISENGVGRIIDSKYGLFQVRLENCADLTNCEFWPQQVWVSYKAGYPLRNTLMDRRLERQLCRLANIRNPYEVNTDCSERILTMWQRDQDIISNEFSRVASAPPWGSMKYGDWDSWNNLKHMRLNKTTKITRRSL